MSTLPLGATPHRPPPVQPSDANDKHVGWPSDRPIPVGRPTLDFEPTAVRPEYRTAPYRPDTTIDGWSTSAFAIRAASLRGYSHRYAGAPRQDDFAIALCEDTNRLIIAVADGVSAARQSHIGASTAVRYATQWLKANVAASVGETDWKGLAESTAWAVIEQAAALAGESEANPKAAEELVATTLVCSVLETQEGGALVAHTLGIGDSGAWLLSGGKFSKLWGGKKFDTEGLTSSAVSGLPRIPVELRATRTVIDRLDVFLLGTDGFGDPLGDGDGDVGRHFVRALCDRVPSLLEFAHVLDFSRETFDDDRTLIAVWPRAVSQVGGT